MIQREQILASPSEWPADLCMSMRNRVFGLYIYGQLVIPCFWYQKQMFENYSHSLKSSLVSLCCLCLRYAAAAELARLASDSPNTALLAACASGSLQDHSSVITGPMPTVHAQPGVELLCVVRAAARAALLRATAQVWNYPFLSLPLYFVQ